MIGCCALAGSPAGANVGVGFGASNQFGNIVQQIAPLIGAAISNSNNNHSYGYGPAITAPVLATTARRPAITVAATAATRAYSATRAFSDKPLRARLREGPAKAGGSAR